MQAGVGRDDAGWAHVPRKLPRKDPIAVGKSRDKYALVLRILVNLVSLSQGILYARVIGLLLMT